MASPDLARPTKIEGKTYIHSPGSSTAAADVVTCPADSLIRLRTVYVGNSTASAASFRAGIKRSGTEYRLINQATVPANSLFNVANSSDALYLEPGDSLVLTQVTANSMRAFVVYEIVT